MATSVAVKLGQILVDITQIDELLNRPKQMLLRDVVFQWEPIKQRRMCLLLWSHHRQIPRILARFEPADDLQTNKSFSTKLAHFARRCTNL